MADVEFWTWGHSAPRRFTRQAIQAEDHGWDGIVVGESQNLTGDVFVAIAVASQHTSRVKFATGVAVVGTRHPAATAALSASVQAESDGRFLLGIGTGGSAQWHLGLGAASYRYFQNYLERLQGYLRGEEVPFDVAPSSPIASLDAQALKGVASSRLHWLDPTVPKVPVEAAGAGPKTIAMAAKVADRIGLNVGVTPERVRWAVDLAQVSRAEAGLDRVPITAYVPTFVHPDRAKARELATPMASSFAFGNALGGKMAGPAEDGLGAKVEAIRERYDVGEHYQTDAAHAVGLTDDVVDSFVIAGPVDYYVERLLQLIDLGVDRVVMINSNLGMDAGEAKAARMRLVEEVLPTLRKELGAELVP